ncbi:hypothetical protein CTAYLR_010656 [Chrysophaeum taylorii]|uniref:N-acetyltransferase domain-containing protein n=1 Tax=Chrysophaeum taylorii TaxID=2483200 RepID=A0AAD7UJ62_9STRA|nr:hypothetical protein CTAYLR_010656 [Chrysophaeum taylorii]
MEAAAATAVLLSRGTDEALREAGGEGLAVRGRLEAALGTDERRALRPLPLLAHFRRVANFAVRLDGAAPLRPPPARSLVGEIGDLDVALARDRSVPGGFSILLTKANKKRGYVLARIDDPGRFVLRGAFVAEDARGRGLAKVLLGVFLALARKLGARAIDSAVVDKPVLALALASAGFVPRDTRWAIRLINKPGGASIIWPDDPARELTSIYSHKLCKTQRIRIAPRGTTPDPAARLVHVKTAFFWPEDRHHISPDVDFFAARLLAFVVSAPIAPFFFFFFLDEQ